MQYMQDTEMTYVELQWEIVKRKENCTQTITLVFIETRAAKIFNDERDDT